MTLGNTTPLCIGREFDSHSGKHFFFIQTLFIAIHYQPIFSKKYNFGKNGKISGVHFCCLIPSHSYIGYIVYVFGE